MRSIFSPDDGQKILDWAILLAIGASALLFLAVILGLAVFLFRAIGGV